MIIGNQDNILIEGTFPNNGVPGKLNINSDISIKNSHHFTTTMDELIIQSKNSQVKIDDVIIKNGICQLNGIQIKTLKNILISNKYEEITLDKEQCFHIIEGDMGIITLPIIDITNIGMIYYIINRSSNSMYLKTPGILGDYFIDGTTFTSSISNTGEYQNWEDVINNNELYCINPNDTLMILPTNHNNYLNWIILQK